MNDIQISVIIPVYNAQNYLNMTLDSLLSQTFENFEIICVDDGSTDDSLSILEKYERQDSRITILKQKNSFAGVARNNGMSIAKGKYLSFLDADDYFKKDMLEKAYECAECEKADAVIFGGEIFWDSLENSYPLPDILREDLLSKGESFSFIENLFQCTTGAAWNKLFLTSFIKENNLLFHPCKRCNDIYFVYMALVLAKKIGVVRERLISYRTGNAASLQGSKSETPKIFLDECLSIQNEMISRGLYKQYQKGIREMCLTNCIHHFKTQKSIHAFIELYDELRNNSFYQFHIVGTQENDYFDKTAFNTYKDIMQYTALEYLQIKFEEVYKYLAKDYLFPFSSVEKGCNIILYAAGNVGKRFHMQLDKSRYCNVKAWVDKKADYYNDNVKFPKNVNMADCDYVVIAVENKETAEEIIMELLEEYSVPKEKIIWEIPNMSLL